MAVITIDFDHTLEFENGGPNMDTINILRNEHVGDTLIIITSRNFSLASMENITNFLEEHRIFVSNIIHTNGHPKVDFCKAMKSVKHFDDDEGELEMCEAVGIKGVNCFNKDIWDKHLKEELE